MDPNSIVDWLKSQGQPYDYASRATLAASKGIQNYIGSSSQNLQLLNLLRGGGASTTPTVPSSQPSPQPQPTAMATSTATPQAQGGNQGFGDWLRSHGYNDENVIANAIANPSTAGSAYQDYLRESGTGSTGTSGVSGFLNAPTINLPELYEGLYASSGIMGIQGELSEKTKAYNEQVAKIKDNPYLAEATMTGRLSKLADKFNADTLALRSDIATKKADVETKLNIQMKQFDIQSDQAKQALDQFQTLLASGALSNLSGEDIANITRATGLSSSMINAAIAATKAKNVQTSIIQWDDGTNQGFSVVNSQTGEIIKKDSVAASKPSTGTTSSTENIQQQFLEEAKTIKGQSTPSGWVGEFPLLVAKYAPFFSLEEIYKLYMQSVLGKQYGAPMENAGDIKEIYDAYRGA